MSWLHYLPSHPSSRGSFRGRAPHCQRIKHPRLRSQPAMPQHCIYWRLLFTQAHDRSSDPREKSHPLLILSQVSGAWQTFIKEPQHGATARPFFLLPFFYPPSHSPPPGGGPREAGEGACRGHSKSCRASGSGVAGCLCLLPLFVDPYQGKHCGVGWGGVGLAVGPGLLSKSLEDRKSTRLNSSH